VLPVTSVELLGSNANQFAMESFCGSSVGVSATCRIRAGHKVAQLKVVARGKPARFRNIAGTAQ
jgi:hypothetical protein